MIQARGGARGRLLTLACAVLVFGCTEGKSSPKGANDLPPAADAAAGGNGGGQITTDAGANGNGAEDGGGNASSSEDGGSTVGEDASGPAPGNCSRDISQADPALVEGLVKAMQLWTWSKEKSGDQLTDITDACDRSIAYRVGPEVILEGTVQDYAACAIATGAMVEFSAGRFEDPGSCTDISCTGKLGVQWRTATSGAVFVLDPNTGKPVGSAQFYLVLYSVLGDPYTHLVWSGNGSGTSGYLMDAQLGDTTVLKCQ